MKNRYAIIGGLIVWLGAGLIVSHTDAPFIPSLISVGGCIVFLYGVGSWLMSKRKERST